MIPNNLICPLCHTPLTLKDRSFVCSGEKQHSYDMASSGYVNLLPPGKMKNAKTGDGKDMLRARVEFLSGGYYDVISNRIADHIAEHFRGKPSVSIVDAGCGEGYHLCNITSRLSSSFDVCSVGIDASKHGADMGAKAARAKKLSAFFAAGNIFSLPIADGSADVLISMFAPIGGEEAARVLSDDGILIVCASGVRHLWEMRSIIYDEPRENTKGIKCPEGFEEIDGSRVFDRAFIPDGDTIKNLFTMTPFYHRCPYEGRERLMATDKLDITIEANVAIFKKI